MIQKITDNDLETIRDLFRTYQTELGVDLCFQNFENELMNLPGIYSEPNGTILKAVIENKIVGCVALKPLPDGTCEMKRLFVQNSHKGIGIGKALALQIIAEAKLKGFKIMKLDTLKRLKPAVQLYKKIGFNITEPYNYNPEADILYFELPL